ncbi:hypothetical protein GH733_016651 [Mirounga leonina]|nr:hypothetical protein GH733_016651 [Mirounga leonina]
MDEMWSHKLKCFRWPVGLEEKEQSCMSVADACQSRSSWNFDKEELFFKRHHLFSDTGKKVLIVYAHQEPRSINGSLKKVAMEELSRQGCTITFFNYGVEVYEAFKKRSLASDITDEQKKVQEADLVIFQFPLYWFGMPAILKGWMDRVLCQGFAFDIPGFYDSGFLKNKLALLSLTTGSTAEMYTRTGVSGDFRYFLWPLQHGALHFCGFKILAPQISFAPEIASEEERKAMVASWAQRLKTIWEEEPIDCTPPWYFGQ